jgi:hypothetical protein
VTKTCTSYRKRKYTGFLTKKILLFSLIKRLKAGSLKQKLIKIFPKKLNLGPLGI